MLGWFTSALTPLSRGTMTNSTQPRDPHNSRRQQQASRYTSHHRLQISGRSSLKGSVALLLLLVFLLQGQGTLCVHLLPRVHTYSTVKPASMQPQSGNSWPGSSNCNPTGSRQQGAGPQHRGASSS